MKTKIKKILNFTLVMIMIFTTIAPNFGIVLSEVYAAEATVNYLGTASYGGSTVGNFLVNGQQAFCMEHAKTTPPSNTNITSSVYEDENIAKCLYYGWGGAGQWSGFTSSNMGIVITSLALDHFYNGNRQNIASDFINFVTSQPLPRQYLTFSNGNLTAYKEGDVQRTQETSLDGNSEYSISFSLQNGVTLHNLTKGTTSTGVVTINGGDRFYLSTPLNSGVVGNWVSENINNSCYKLSSIIWTSGVNNYQKLGQSGNFIIDPSRTINLSVEWLSLGGLTIQKQDDNGTLLKNVSFDIWNNEGYSTTKTTDQNGEITIDELVPTTYFAKEKSALNGYLLDDTTYEIIVQPGVQSSDNITVVTNKEPTGSLTIVKQDETTKNKLSIDGTYRHGDASISGATYTLYAKEKIANVAKNLTYFEKNEEIATFTFNEQGVATIKITNTNTPAKLKVNGTKLEGLPMGRIYFKRNKCT